MSDLIDDETAHILWQPGPDLKVERVLVTKHIRLTKNASERERTEAAGQRRDYHASAGSDTAGWLNPSEPTASPAGVFATLAFRYGFASEDGAGKCLKEFAKIRGAEWARQMLTALEEDA